MSDRHRAASLAAGRTARRAIANAMFDRLDANQDGAISRDEFAKGHDADRAPGRDRTASQASRVSLARDGTAWQAPYGRRGGTAWAAHVRRMADANKDGRVSLQEAASAARQHFDMADANHDGRMTPDEQAAMHRR